MTDEKSLNRRTVSAGLWAIAMRWSIRFIGVLSTLILVRILSPEDFGIVAMAVIVSGITQVLLELGVNMAIIQHSNATKAVYDSAWTLRIAQTSFSAILLVLVAPLAAGYFHEPRIVNVLYVTALSIFISGFENIGIVTFQKELNFSKDFQFLVTKKFGAAIITVLLALQLKSYWSLVLGSLSATILGVMFSYYFSSYRPSVSFLELKSLWSFSQWIVVRNIGAFFQTKLDQLIIGGRLGTSAMGTYSVADEFASMPTNEVLAPINRALFPAFAIAKKDYLKLKGLFADAYGFQCTVAIPMGCGFYMIADEFVPVVLGENWLDAIPIIRVLALVGVALALRHSPSSLLTAIGQVKVIAIVVWVQVSVFLGLCTIVFPETGLIGIATIRLLLSALQTFVFVGIIVGQDLCSFKKVLEIVLRPVLSAVAMMWVLAIWGQYFVDASILNLVIQIILGFLTYTFALILIWFLSGKPEGIERSLILKYKELGR